MCVIYVATEKIPPMEELKRGADRNDDGAGVAWLGPHPKKPEVTMVWWQKGLKDEKEVMKFIEKKKLQLPLLIHFRTASIGGISKALTHPFPVMEDVPLWEAGYANEVLFHNGHLHDWEDLLVKAGLTADVKFPIGNWSDTRALAWLTYLKGPGILPFILKGSRVALFYADPLTEAGKKYDRANDHVDLFGSWVAKDGWSQSIETDFGTQVTPGRYRSDAGKDTTRPGSCDNPRSLGPGLTTPVHSDLPKLTVWSTDELRTILVALQKEQKDAQAAVGIS